MKTLTAILLHPNALLGPACLFLIWTYLGQHTEWFVLCMLFLGPSMVVHAKILARPDTTTEYHSTTACQCIALLLLGILAETTNASNFLLAAGVVLTQVSIMFLNTDHDQAAQKAKMHFTWVLVLETQLYIPFDMAEKPMPLWFITVMAILTILIWRHAMWNSIDLRPLSRSQQDYWPTLSQTETMFVFWKTLRNYTGLYTQANTPEQISSAIAHLDMAPLLDYLKDHNAYVVPGYVCSVENNIVAAVKRRISDIDPRTDCIWHLFGEHDLPGSIAAIEALDSLRGDSLALPALG